MNNNSFDNKEPFYNGGNDYQGGGFYTGYDNSSESGTGSFNEGGSGGYGMPDPDPLMMYNDIRSRKVINYDNFGFGGAAMEDIRRMHPNAKLSTPIDGRSRLIKALIVGGIFLLIGLVYMGWYISKDAAQTDMINNSDVVEAQLEYVLEGQKFPESLLRIKSYNVTYRYYYDGNYYGGMDQLTLDQLHMVGLDKSSSKEEGIRINVNVSRTDPKSSLLIKENYIGRGFMFLAFFAAVAVIFIIVGAKLYSDCASGKTAVYINEQGKKVYQKLK